MEKNTLLLYVKAVNTKNALNYAYSADNADVVHTTQSYAEFIKAQAIKQNIANWLKNRTHKE